MKALGLRTLLTGWLWLGPAMLTVSAAGAQTVKPGPLVGKTAPEFEVQGIYCEPLSLHAFRGHILVMQFGASW